MKYSDREEPMTCRAPAVAWNIMIVGCALAWSFHLVSFLHAKDAVLVAGLVPVFLVQRHCRCLTGRGLRQFRLLWWGWAFWTVTGVFTAQVLSYHIEDAARFALLLVSASLAWEAFTVPGGRQGLLMALWISGASVGALALLQYTGYAEALLPAFPGYTQRAYSVFGNQNLLGGYMAVNLALLVSVHTRAYRLSRAALTFHVLAVTLVSGALLVSATRSAWLAAAVACAWALLQSGILRRPAPVLRRWWRTGFVFIVLLLLLAALIGLPLVWERTLITLTEADVGGRARLWFWAGALLMAGDHPLFGVGLGNYNYWSPGYQGEALRRPWGAGLFRNELHTVHAHSEPFDWLAQTGLFGTLFLICFFVCRIRRRDTLLPGLIALAVFACFNSFAHSAPHVLAVLLIAGAAGKKKKCAKGPPVAASVVAYAVAGAVAACAVTWTTLIPSVLLNRAEQTHIAGSDPEALYQRALAWPWPNPRARESYAIMLMDMGRFEEAGAQLEQALLGIDTGRIHLLLAITAEAQDAPAMVAEHARACLDRWPVNDRAKHLLRKSEAVPWVGRSDAIRGEPEAQGGD